MSAKPLAKNSARSVLRDPHFRAKLLGDFIDGQAVAIRIATQNIRAKYRKSFLGILWSILPPLLISGGFALANRSSIFRVDATPIPYPAFVLIGVVLWQLFAECLEGPNNALEGARSFITRISFPREAFLTAHFVEIAFSALVRITIIAFILMALGVKPSISFLLLPIPVVGVMLLGFGIGMLITPLLVLVNDFVFVLRILMTYGMFLAPVVYPPPAQGLFHWVVKFNPVTPLMTGARDFLLGTELTEPVSFFAMVLGGAVLVVLGFLLMRIALPFLLERMLIGGR